MDIEKINNINTKIPSSELGTFEWWISGLMLVLLLLLISRLIVRLRKRVDQALIPISTIQQFPAQGKEQMRTNYLQGKNKIKCYKLNSISVRVEISCLKINLILKIIANPPIGDIFNFQNIRLAKRLATKV